MGLIATSVRPSASPRCRTMSLFDQSAASEACEAVATPFAERLLMAAHDVNLDGGDLYGTGCSTGVAHTHVPIFLVFYLQCTVRKWTIGRDTTF